MTASDERYLGFLVSDTARLQRTVFDRRVRALGVTRSLWMVLRRLARAPGASQSELAELLEVEKATAGRLIDRLEENGWVERRADPEDRRVNRIYMTEKGARVNDAIAPISRAMIDEAFGDLTPEERERFTDMIITVKRRLQAMAEESLSEAVLAELEEA
ncbi:MAG: MarR family transcriptional regulator [Methyloligellaceae bacterium]